MCEEVNASASVVVVVMGDTLPAAMLDDSVNTLLEQEVVYII